jgi:uncharacterized HhH-GPD family protein
VTTPQLHLAGDNAADELLARDPFALITGLLLDQQIPMEWAFTGPYTIASRLGVAKLDPAAISEVDPDEFAKVMAGPPAVHRYPKSMGERVQKLAAYVNETYGGDPALLWLEATSGADLLRRAKAMPGYGEQKAKILVALLGKQFGVRPEGWREAAGAYGDQGSRRSIADVVDDTTLTEVREFKREAKRAAKGESPSRDKG